MPTQGGFQAMSECRARYFLVPHRCSYNVDGLGRTDIPYGTPGCYWPGSQLSDSPFLFHLYKSQDPGLYIISLLLRPTGLEPCLYLVEVPRKRRQANYTEHPLCERFLPGAMEIF